MNNLGDFLDCQLEEDEDNLTKEVGIYPVCDRSRHLVCEPYSLRNLHEVARSLGIKRCWFHKDHYDLPLRRKEAIEKIVEENGYIVTSRELLRIIKSNKERL